MISLSDPKSVTRAADAYSEIEEKMRKQYKEKNPRHYRDDIPMPIMLACNKCDLEDTNPEMVKVSKSEIISKVGVHESQVMHMEIHYSTPTLYNLSQVIYTSAKEGTRVQEAFKQAVELIPGALPNSSDSRCPIS